MVSPEEKSVSKSRSALGPTEEDLKGNVPSYVGAVDDKFTIS